LSFIGSKSFNKAYPWISGHGGYIGPGEAMVARSVRFLCLSCSALLMLASVIGWFSYMGNGIAYRALVGLAGREHDLAELSGRAERALAFGATCEAVAIGIGSWALIPIRNPRWARICFAVVLAATADIFTFAVVRGI
jgi:hypothetical protein